SRLQNVQTARVCPRGDSRFPGSSLWPLAVPSEAMALEIGAAKKRIAGQIRNAPKVASPADLESYVGSPVPVLGLSVPTMRAIVAAFATAHKRSTATELNALAAALWSGRVFEEKSLAILLLGRYERFSTMTRGGSQRSG